jgi:peptide deformylase
MVVMAAREILLLGNPDLYRTCSPVAREELSGLAQSVDDLHDTMSQFQREFGWGRAIAAPQIGVTRRIVCMRVDEAHTLFNPVLEPEDDERFEYWEDCMSFPELLVRVDAPVRAIVRYRDTEWTERRLRVEMDYAGMLQHEIDHLDGKLAVQRALDDRSFALRRACPKDPAMRGSLTWLEP